MKRPSDKQIRLFKVVFWTLIVLTWILAFNIQNLVLENSIFWFTLDGELKTYLSYWIIALGAIPILLGGLDINVLSRGRTRILQIAFGILLFIISGIFVETATLSADILYFLLGLVAFFAGVTGKTITKKWLKAGQKITKIRV